MFLCTISVDSQKSMQFAVGKCLRNFYHVKYRLLMGYYYEHEYYSTCKIVEFVIKNKLGHFEIHYVGVNINKHA